MTKENEETKEAETAAEEEGEKKEATKNVTLKDLEGLGEKRLAELEAAGVGDINDLLGADIEDLANKTSFSEDRIRKWQKSAASKVPEILEEELEVVGEKLEAVREEIESWKPRTELGAKVKSGAISSIDEVLCLSTPIKEVEIVDKFLPELAEEILDVGRVQRVTDSGRRMRFRVVTAVGNANGYVGVGEAKGKEAGPTIRKAIERAKLNIVNVKRGCGSWQCGCGTPHTVPFKVSGKSGGVEVELRPAPRGVGLVSGEIPKKILALAGVTDAWVKTHGHTRTSLNFAHAIYNALSNTNKVKIKESDSLKLNIISGAVQAPAQVQAQTENA